MKTLVAMLLLLALAVFFLAAQSFQSRLFETTYSPPFTLETPSAPQELGGGVPRKVTAPAATPPIPATSSNNSGFQGPSSPPRVTGPSGPPPGQ